MILKALSGFYYVDDGTQLFACRGRGKFRHEKVTPLVGAVYPAGTRERLAGRDSPQKE